MGLFRFSSLGMYINLSSIVLSLKIPDYPIFQNAYHCQESLALNVWREQRGKIVMIEAHKKEFNFQGRAPFYFKSTATFWLKLPLVIFVHIHKNIVKKNIFFINNNKSIALCIGALKSNWFCFNNIWLQILLRIAGLFLNTMI